MKPEAFAGLSTVLVAFACCLSVGAFGGGSPTILAPASLFFVLPVFQGVPLVLAISIFIFAFAMWILPQYRGSSALPTRTLVLLGMTAFVSMLWYVIGWNFSVHVEGMPYVATCFVLSCAMLLGCALLALRAREKPNYLVNLSAHALLFVWLATYAFPYLGATP